MAARSIACPANLVSTAWQLACPQERRKIKVYPAVANRAGTEQKLVFNGGSVLYNPDGQPLARARKTGRTVITLPIEPARACDKCERPAH